MQPRWNANTTQRSGIRFRVCVQCSGRIMRFWVAGSAVLTGCGAAIVFSQGYFAISEQGSDGIGGLFTGAGIGFVGAGLLCQALIGRLERFPSGVPGGVISGLRRKAICYSVGGIILVFSLVAFGGFTIAGDISC